MLRRPFPCIPRSCQARPSWWARFYRQSLEFWTLLNLRLTVGQMALLGATVYGVYELTNHATLDKWPIWMVVVDTLWGAALFAAGGAVVRALSTKKSNDLK